MSLGIIAGTISTTIFMLSQIPMLLKAVRTRSLHSYSLTNILMSTGGNLIHWCYISTLPFGPIWFLHSFSSITAALMLIWYLRYEKGASSNQSILSSALFEKGGDMITQVNKDPVNTRSGKEMSEFHIHFRPYVNLIYRGALIMTGNPRSAEKLQVKIYMKAFMQYLQTGSVISFKKWLLEIVTECFSELTSGQVEQDAKSEMKQEKALQLIASNNSHVSN
jgi:hypothetical protein